MKWLLPVIWTSFFGTLTLLVVAAVPFEGSGPIPVWAAKLLAVSFFGSGLLLLYLMFMRLKRVDFGETHFYVSNYFRTYRYTYDSVQKITLEKGLFARRAIIHFHSPSSFGLRVTFLPSHRLEEFIKAYPEIGSILMVEDFT